MTAKNPKELHALTDKLHQLLDERDAELKRCADNYMEQEQIHRKYDIRIAEIRNKISIAKYGMPSKAHELCKRMDEIQEKIDSLQKEYKDVQTQLINELLRGGVGTC